MSSTATDFAPPGVNTPTRMDVLFAEMSELTGQRNAIDGRLADIVAEIDRDGIWGATGCRSIPALVAWKTGMSSHNAEVLAAVAHRSDELPLCTGALREGRLSLDQVGAIATGAGEGGDAHYLQFALNATVSQLRKAIKLEPPPPPAPTDSDKADEPEESEPEPPRSITKTEGEQSTTWTITLPRLEAAKFEAGLASHRDALIAQWRRDHPDHDPEVIEAEDRARDRIIGHTVYDGDGQIVRPPIPDHGPFPTTIDAFLNLVDAGWDADVAARPHGQRTTVVVHVDVDKKVATLHLGPLLSDSERRFLTCDATCEVWFERHGQVIGAGRETRQINRRLRRALEHRDRCCVIPGCGATRGLHAHHLVHWENGGRTDLDNLVLLCPFHHRLHHRGGITLTGPAHQLVVTDQYGRQMHGGSLARPPTQPPPSVPPYRGPTGERADWWWYDPYEPPPPTPPPSVD